MLWSPAACVPGLLTLYLMVNIGPMVGVLHTLPEDACSFNLTLRNFRAILSWEVKNHLTVPTHYTLSYTYMSKGEDTKIVPNCTNITRPSCDLTYVWGNAAETYVPTVVGLREDSELFNCSGHIFPDMDMFLEPPDFQIAGFVDHINVVLKFPPALPKVPGEEGLWPYLSLVIEEVSEGIVKQHNLKINENTTGDFTYVLNKLIPNTNYCVSVYFEPMDLHTITRSPLKCTHLQPEQGSGIDQNGQQCSPCTSSGRGTGQREQSGSGRSLPLFSPKATTSPTVRPKMESYDYLPQRSLAEFPNPSESFSEVLIFQSKKRVRRGCRRESSESAEVGKLMIMFLLLAVCISTVVALKRIGCICLPRKLPKVLKFDSSRAWVALVPPLEAVAVLEVIHVHRKKKVWDYNYDDESDSDTDVVPRASAGGYTMHGLTIRPLCPASTSSSATLEDCSDPGAPDAELPESEPEPEGEPQAPMVPGPGPWEREMGGTRPADPFPEDSSSVEDSEDRIFFNVDLKSVFVRIVDDDSEVPPGFSLPEETADSGEPHETEPGPAGGHWPSSPCPPGDGPQPPEAPVDKSDGYIMR